MGWSMLGAGPFGCLYLAGGRPSVPHWTWPFAERTFRSQQGRMDRWWGWNFSANNELSSTQWAMSTNGWRCQHLACLGRYVAILFAAKWELACHQWGCKMLFLHHDRAVVLDQIPGFQQAGTRRGAPWRACWQEGLHSFSRLAHGVPQLRELSATRAPKPCVVEQLIEHRRQR